MSNFEKTKLRLEERIMRSLALLAGYILLAQAVITSFEIIARKLFNHSFQGVDEIGGYALAISASIGFGYATITRAHTRIDLLLMRLPLACRVILHQLASLVLLAVASGFFWFGLRTLRQSISYNSISTTPLQTPLWIPQSIWVFGLALFAIVSLVMVLRGLVMFTRGDFSGIERQMKAQSQEQQELDAAGFSISPSGKEQ